MCGRYSLHHSTDQIVMRFQVNEVRAETVERYNIAPTEAIPVITVGQGQRRLEAYQWGLLPSWAKDAAMANKLINARAETLAEKPAFRNALTRRRCIIPGDGFFEWKKEETGKQPMYIHRQDDELFGFAGLWEEWLQPNGEPLRTCTIITVEPNALMQPIHHRMPAILTKEQEALWLDRELQDKDALLSLLQPYPFEWLETYPVSRKVNAPGADGPVLIAPNPETSGGTDNPPAINSL